MSSRKQRIVINGKSSNWTDVTNGVPQGSVLEPILFLVYIIDIDKGFSCITSKFANDAKIASTVLNYAHCIEIQSNFDKLSNWVQTWQMYSCELMKGKYRH